MPRFDNEGFNPNRRIDNDKRDRTVPTDENYYGGNVDLNFNSKQKGDEDERNLIAVADGGERFLPMNLPATKLSARL